MRHVSSGSSRRGLRWVACCLALGLGLSSADAADAPKGESRSAPKAESKSAAKVEAARVEGGPVAESSDAVDGAVTASAKAEGPAGAPSPAPSTGEGLSRLGAAVVPDDEGALARWRAALEKERSLDALTAVSEDGLDPAAVAWLRARRVVLLKQSGKAQDALELQDLLLAEATADQREPLRKALGARAPVADASVRGRLGIALPLSGKYKKWGSSRWMESSCAWGIRPASSS